MHHLQSGSGQLPDRCLRLQAMAGMNWYSVMQDLLVQKQPIYT